MKFDCCRSKLYAVVVHSRRWHSGATVEMRRLTVSRQFLDRQFLDWVRVTVRVRVRVRVAVQELTVQELSCSPPRRLEAM